MEILSIEIVVFCEKCKKMRAYTIFEGDKKLYCECDLEIEIEEVNIEIKLHSKQITKL